MENNNMGSTKSDGVTTSSTGCIMSNGTGSLDLTGKVIVKVQLEDNIRRVPIHNEDITYDELVLMMQRLFKGQLKSDDDIVIKYKDEDGDMISLSDSADLHFAIQCCRVLKLKIYLTKDKDAELQDKIFKKLPIGVVRSELRDLRDRVTRMLDLLDIEDDKKYVVDPSANANMSLSVRGSKTPETGRDSPSAAAKGKKAPEGSLSPGPGPANATPPPVTVSTKEFDPLQHQQHSTIVHRTSATATGTQAPPPVSNKAPVTGPSPTPTSAFNINTIMAPHQQHGPQPIQTQPALRQPPTGSGAPTNDQHQHQQSIQQQPYPHQQHPTQTQQMYQQQQQMPSYQQQQHPHPSHAPVPVPQAQTPIQSQQPQSNVHQNMSQPQPQPQAPISYPNSSTAAPMSGYNYMYPPQQPQQAQTQAGPVSGGAITGQPQSQQGQGQYPQGGAFPPPAGVPPPPQAQQYPGQYAPPPTSGYPTTPGANPFSRHPPPSHYKSQ